MAGIYIHIPFCRQKCAYCDFHFSTDSSYAARMVKAICTELVQRSEELVGQAIKTVYFGGGTPSLLPNQLLEDLFRTIRQQYDCDPAMEVTLESNPEDLYAEAAAELKQLGVNRLSIGIQSFDDKVLVDMNRSHDAGQALKAVRSAQTVGVQNISVDIIYGLPNKTIEEFEYDLSRFIELEVPHISAYALTIEKGTLYHHKVANGTMRMPEDHQVEQQFFKLGSTLLKAGYEQYEVSNFARPGAISQHNSAYWQGADYVGVGPSAHSFDGKSRTWNIANNFKYMQAIEKGEKCNEREHLDADTRYNEYILTRLRTKWGIDLAYIKEEFDIDILSQFKDVWSRHAGRFSILEGKLILNAEGLILADGLASDLFQIK